MAVGIADSGDVVRQVIAVVCVFGLLAFAVGKLRTRGGSSKSAGGSGNLMEFFQGPIFKIPAGSTESRQLISVERLKLTQQHTLHLVRAGNTDVLIVTHPQGCSLLSGKMTGGESSPDGSLIKKVTV